jgi:hypothetical protein
LRLVPCEGRQGTARICARDGPAARGKWPPTEDGRRQEPAANANAAASGAPKGLRDSADGPSVLNEYVAQDPVEFGTPGHLARRLASRRLDEPLDEGWLRYAAAARLVRGG